MRHPGRPGRASGQGRGDAATSSCRTTAIVTTDAGNFGTGPPGFRFRRPGTFLGSTSGAMGYGLPAAIAAGLVHRDRAVVALVGDGGLGMTLAELETAVRSGLRTDRPRLRQPALRHDPDLPGARGPGPAASRPTSGRSTSPPRPSPRGPRRPRRGRRLGSSRRCARRSSPIDRRSSISSSTAVGRASTASRDNRTGSVRGAGVPRERSRARSAPPTSSGRAGRIRTSSDRRVW